MVKNSKQTISNELRHKCGKYTSCHCSAAKTEPSYLSFGKNIQTLRALRKEWEEQLRSLPKWRQQQGRTNRQRVQNCLRIDRKGNNHHHHQNTWDQQLVLLSINKQVGHMSDYTEWKLVKLFLQWSLYTTTDVNLTAIYNHLQTCNNTYNTDTQNKTKYIIRSLIPLEELEKK